MSHRRALIRLLISLGLSFAVGLACGNRGGGGDDDDDDASGQDQYWCCLNGSYYTCPNAAAVDACAGGFDLGGCQAACAPGDFACLDACMDQMNAANPDPSGCDRNAGRDSACEGGGDADADSDADTDADSDADTDADSDADADGDCPCGCNTGPFCDPDPDFPDTDCDCDNDCPDVLYCDCDANFDVCDDDPCDGHMCDCDPSCF